MSKNQETTNTRKVGDMIITNIHKTTDKNELSEMVNQKISNLIRNDLQRSATLC